MQAAIILSAEEAQAQFDDLLDRIHDHGETILVERSNKPVVAVIPIELYEQFMVKREERFAVIDRIWAKVPDMPEDEVLDDVAEAIAAIRQ